MVASRLGGDRPRRRSKPSTQSPHIPLNPHNKCLKNQQLTHLQCLLEHLPDSVPHHNTQSATYCFSVCDDDIEEYGDKNLMTTLTSTRFFSEARPRIHGHQLRGGVLQSPLDSYVWKQGIANRLTRSGRVCDGGVEPRTPLSLTASNCE